MYFRNTLILSFAMIDIVQTRGEEECRTVILRWKGVLLSNNNVQRSFRGPSDPPPKAAVVLADCVVNAVDRLVARHGLKSMDTKPGR